MAYNICIVATPVKRLQSQCIGTKNPDGKTTWKCVAAEDQQTLPPEWKSEEDFFKWIGVEYKKPQLRNI